MGVDQGARRPLHYAFLLALETGLLGLFASLDVILFYIFFEFTLIPLFFLIGIWGGPQRRRASVTFFLYTLAGSLLTLLGVIALVVVHYQFSPGNVLTFSIPELTQGPGALDWPEWRQADSWTSPQVVIFLLLLAGFAIKVPMFPFHTWLPLAHVEAPTAGSVLLAGVLLKVGSYGLLRFNMGMTPLGADGALPAAGDAGRDRHHLRGPGGAGADRHQAAGRLQLGQPHGLHRARPVLAQRDGDGRRGDPDAQPRPDDRGPVRLRGRDLRALPHATMDEMGGLWNRLPLLAFFFILASLGSAALPGLNGFVGEFPILVGAFDGSPRAAVLAATGMILGAYYLLWMLRRVIFGPLREPADTTAMGTGKARPATSTARRMRPARRSAGTRSPAWRRLMFLIVAIGVYPRPFFEQIQPAVARDRPEHRRPSATGRARRPKAEPTAPVATPRGPGGGGGDAEAAARAANGNRTRRDAKAAASDKTSEKGGQ